jgi:hypothetical protein
MTATVYAPPDELKVPVEAAATGLRILRRVTVGTPMSRPQTTIGSTAMYGSLIDSWELVEPGSMCLHTSLRGRPRPYFMITRFDGPTLDRIMRRMQLVFGRR